MSSTILDESHSADPVVVEKRTVRGQAKVVPIDARLRDLQNDARSRGHLESLSAYFTIAAAAFGLISDGCKCLDLARS